MASSRFLPVSSCSEGSQSSYCQNLVVHSTKIFFISSYSFFRSYVCKLVSKEHFPHGPADPLKRLSKSTRRDLARAFSLLLPELYNYAFVFNIPLG